MSSSGTALPLGADISSPYNGLYYGFVFSCMLFGVTILQGWIYFTNNKDAWWMQLFVGVLVLSDFTTTCLDIQIGHHYVISNFGNLANLGTVTREFSSEFAITVIVVLSVQLFFASRVYLIRRNNKIVPAVIVLTAILSFVAGIVSVVDQFKNDSAEILGLTRRKVEIGLMHGFASISDIVATIALSWTLSVTKSESGIRSTSQTLSRLLMYTISRGVLISIVQTILLVLYSVQTLKLYWMTPHLCLNKLYVITMIAMLNSRFTRDDNSGPAVVTDTDLHSSNGTTSHSHSILGSRTVARVKSAAFELNTFANSGSNKNKSSQGQGKAAEVYIDISREQDSGY